MRLQLIVMKTINASDKTITIKTLKKKTPYEVLHKVLPYRLLIHFTIIEGSITNTEYSVQSKNETITELLHKGTDKFEAIRIYNSYISQNT